MEQGLLHLYWGDGKGKTTAAMGLALRALGSGKTVVIVQFLKGGKSGEVPLLEQLGAKIYRGKAGQKFVFRMNDAEKAATRQLQNENLRAAMAQPADEREAVADAAPQRPPDGLLDRRRWVAGPALGRLRDLLGEGGRDRECDAGERHDADRDRRGDDRDRECCAQFKHEA